MNTIITGSSRGIGLEFCRTALKAGSQVLAVARNPEDSVGLNQLWNEYPKMLHRLAVDVTDKGAGDEIAERAKILGSIDLLINNAGVYPKGDSANDFTSGFAVNAIAPYQIARALLPALRLAKNPKLVQISSLMGSMADNNSGGSVAYRASKAALNMINKCIAVENTWLIATVFHPGWVRTDMGGGGAPVEPPDSVAGMWKVMEGLRTKDSGAFIDFRGKPLPW